MDAGVTGEGACPDAVAPARTAPAHGARWALRSAVAADVEAIAGPRATVLRADPERLGRYDEHRVRQRLRDSFPPGMRRPSRSAANPWAASRSGPPGATAGAAAKA